MTILDNMTILEFVQQWQGVLGILIFAPFATVMYRRITRFIRNAELRDMKMEASIYASQKVNGEFKHYSEEWHRHYNERLEYLIKEYRFTIT